MDVERVPSGLTIVRVVHASPDRRVVVAADRHAGHVAHRIAGLVRRAAVADRVPEAVEDVDGFVPEGLEHGAQGFDVGVDVTRDAEPRPFAFGALSTGASNRTR